MSIEFLNQRQLAERLGVTARRLRDLEAAGVILPAARGRYEVRDAQRRYGLYRSGDALSIAELADEAGDLIAAVQRGVRRLDPERNDPDEVKRLGRMLEQADGALKLLAAMRPEPERTLADEMRRRIVGGLFGTLWEHLEDARAFERRPAAGTAA